MYNERLERGNVMFCWNKNTDKELNSIDFHAREERKS